MSTTTRTTTQTITAADVRQVLSQVGREIDALCRLVSQAARGFDLDKAQLDLSLLALNDVISVIRVQFYLQDELVREHSYVISDEALQASGPPANQPPTGSLPPGTRVRLAVSHNLRQPQEVREGWFRRLGWSNASPLRRPEGGQPQTYGAFASGGYGVSRQLWVNPRFDRPAA